MAPGTAATTNYSPWTIRITVGSPVTGANDIVIWGDTSSHGYFNRRHDDELWDRAEAVFTRAMQLALWTRDALCRATVLRRQWPARAPSLAPRRSVARPRSALSHGRWRAALAGA